MSKTARRTLVMFCVVLGGLLFGSREAAAFCLFGCEDGDHLCDGTCPKGNSPSKSCDDNAHDYESHLRSRIDHSCKLHGATSDQIFSCGWARIRADFPTSLSKRGITPGSQREQCMIGKLKAAPQVVALIDAIAAGGAGSCGTLGIHCAFGPCECGDTCDAGLGCPSNNTRSRTCPENVSDFAGKISHLMHHRCRNVANDHLIFECGWRELRASFPVAIQKRGAGPGTPGEVCLRAGLHANAQVQAKIHEIIGGHTGGICIFGCNARQHCAIGCPALDIVGGTTIATNRVSVNPPDAIESCGDGYAGGAHVPQPTQAQCTASNTSGCPYYYLIPNDLTDAPAANYPGSGAESGHHLGQNEARLRHDLRKAACNGDPNDPNAPCVRDPVNFTANPLESLRLSAWHFALNEGNLGKAFADLAVSGRRAFHAFRASPPTVASLTASLHASPAMPGTRPPEAQLTAGITKALDRAYRVANVLRIDHASPERKELGWIAVSSEDDMPYRPVNVPSTRYPQYDLVVPVHGKNVSTRYMIAQTRGNPSVVIHTGHRLPPDPTPTIEPNAEVFLYVHGMDSRAEEAEDMANALVKMAPAGKDYVMISVDLPGAGYADHFSHFEISSIDVLGRPKLTPLPIPIALPPEVVLLIPGLPPVIPAGYPIPDFDAHGRHNAPLLQFMEDFVVSFVDTLEPTLHLKSKIKAAIGGSLGGNLTLRLGRRTDLPWLPAVVPWSPGSIWDGKADGADILNHIGVRTGWRRAGGQGDYYPAIDDDRTVLQETAGRRKDWFANAFDGAIPLVGPQPRTWYRKEWKCIEPAIVGDRLDRTETYSKNFRLWHWRLGTEQLIYSHQGRDGSGHPLYLSNHKRTLFACGKEDDFKWAGICSATQHTAALMTNTPGKGIFLEHTGHSIHNERPNFWTRTILDFFSMPANTGPSHAVPPPPPTVR